MKIFEVLQIRKNIKQAQKDPGGFAGEQISSMIWSVVVIPLIVCIFVVAVFFIIGYTNLFGFHLGFFKFLFWISLFVVLVLLSLFRRIVRYISKTTQNQTRKVVEAVVVEENTDPSV